MFFPGELFFRRVVVPEYESLENRLRDLSSSDSDPTTEERLDDYGNEAEYSKFEGGPCLTHKLFQSDAGVF
ncbi:hypothetical protein CEXT_568841 [Caerostris extrusa]|uniref:Uncharacterized protein n=1 Tax=Caerostris extrusa TaxID=172846 RepID=A0AAV4YB75_CAEEX|nr:hypothetical protein CEXT_568841 [Caerostris extrusa]